MRSPAPLVVTTFTVAFVLVMARCNAGVEGAAGPERVVVKLRGGVAPAAIPGGAGATWAGLRAEAVFRRPAFVDASRFPRRARRAATGVPPGLTGVYALEVPASRTARDLLAQLSKDPRVEYAQLDHRHELHAVPNDRFWSTAGSWGQPYDDLWALKTLDVEHAWDVARGEGVLVGLVDSGVDFAHGDLASSIYTKTSEEGSGFDHDGNGYPGDRHGWNFVADSNDPQDDHGHGTHVGGLIAATGDNGIGIIGVAPRATILPVKVVDAHGRASSSRIAAGIVYAVEHGADIIVTASGCATRCPSDPVMELAVRHATAAGALVVLSAGNRGEDVASYSPQNMTDPKPLVVSAVDHLGRRESFGNYGDLVDVAAPGGGINVAPPAVDPLVNILSLRSSTCSPVVCSPRHFVSAAGEVPGEYLRRAGTSMSAAYVAGLSALILSANPDLTLDALRRRLFGHAVDLGPAGHDAMFGWGRVAASRAVDDAEPFVLARLFSPAPGRTVDGFVPILGSAAARGFASYEITVGAGAAPSAWHGTGIVGGGAATAQGWLATWDSDQVDDGVWTLRLIVNVVGGGRRERRRTVVVDNSRAKRPLTVKVEGLGAVSLAPPRAFCESTAGSTRTCTHVYDRGALVTLTPVANALSVFEGWGGACSGTGPCTVQVARAREVTARFRGPHHLTIWIRSSFRSLGGTLLVSPPNRNCVGEPCTFAYKPGTAIRLEGEAGPLTTFSWDNDGQPCAGGGGCTVVMNDDIVLGATLVGAPFPGDSPEAYAGIDRTVVLGTSVTLCGQAWSPGNPRSQWHAPPGPESGGPPCVQMEPGLGVHTFLFYVSGEEGETQDDVTITVVPPPGG